MRSDENRPAASFDLRALILPLLLLVGLEWAVRVSGVQSANLASPMQIAHALILSFIDGSLLRATSETLSAAAGGLAIGVLIGLTLGVLFGLFPIVFWLMEFTTEVVRPIPSIALLPVALLVFGFGYTMEISLIAKSAIWPVLFVTHAAISGINPRILEVAKLLDLGPWNKVTKVVLPAVVPAFFVGLRLSVGVAILVAISVEITANPRGLGFAMMRAEETQQADRMLAFLFWTGCLGWVVNSMLHIVQTKVFGRFGRTGEPK